MGQLDALRERLDEHERARGDRAEQQADQYPTDEHFKQAVKSLTRQLTVANEYGVEDRARADQSARRADDERVRADREHDRALYAEQRADREGERADREHSRAEDAEQRAAAEGKRANGERERADQAVERSEAERERADRAENGLMTPRLPSGSRETKRRGSGPRSMRAGSGGWAAGCGGRWDDGRKVFGEQNAMTKSELVRKLAEANPGLYHHDVETIVSLIFEQIAAALAAAPASAATRAMAQAFLSPISTFRFSGLASWCTSDSNKAGLAFNELTGTAAQSSPRFACRWV